MNQRRMHCAETNAEHYPPNAPQKTTPLATQRRLTQPAKAHLQKPGYAPGGRVGGRGRGRGTPACGKPRPPAGPVDNPRGAGSGQLQAVELGVLGGPASQSMLVLVTVTCSMTFRPSLRRELHDLCAGLPGPRGSPPAASGSMWS